MDIKIRNYGFGTDWTLNYYGKDFFLGQDVKFCTRVLGMSPSYIVNEIGSNDLSKVTTRKKLARLIVSELGLTRNNIRELNAWQLCAQ